MRALVTGVAGFIGSHLAARLLDRGDTVLGLDCFTDYYPRAIKEANLATLRGREGFTFLEARLQDFPDGSAAAPDEATLRGHLRGVTHVFHLAAQAGVRKSWGRDFGVYIRDNVAATQILLEACVGLPLERFVYASTSSVYGNHVPIPMREDARLQPLSPYGVTKLAAEHLAMLYQENHGVPAVALRYFTVYGPRQRPDMGFHRFFRAVLSGTPVTLYGDGEQTRDFTFVADAVTGTVAAGDRGRVGEVYNIGGGSRVTVNHVLDLIGRVAGRPLTLDRSPDQKGDMRHTYADTSRARADLGFEPSVTLEEGLKQQYAWMQALDVPR